MKILYLGLIFFTQLSQAGITNQLNNDFRVPIDKALELSKKHQLITSKMGTGFSTVGGDASCDFQAGTTRIQDAINSGIAEIRIASNATYEEVITIDDVSVDLHIRGGFADCTQAQNNNQSILEQDRAIITRPTGVIGSVFKIENLPSGNTTTFEHLKILGGDAVSTSGGSLLVDTTDSDVVLNNVWLTDGTNISTGGGLSVISSNTTVLLNNTDIFQNQTSGNGGGIYCNNFSGINKFMSIVLNQGSNLYNNSSNLEGGGAYIAKDCLFSSFSGSAVDNDGKGIFNNSAKVHGGGLYAQQGGGILLYGGIICGLNGECYGDEDNPVSLYANQADSDATGFDLGSGIYATGVSSDVSIYAGHIYDNHNDGGVGGAIALSDNATLNVIDPRTLNPTANCWNSDKCNLFNNNSALGGGVIYSSSNSTTSIAQATFENNRANDGVVISTSGNSITDIESSVFTKNGLNGTGGFDDNTIMETSSGADIKIRYSTFADNLYQNEVFNVTGSSRLIVLSSIIHDSSNGNILNTATLNGFVLGSCVMAHELTTFPSGNNNVIDDPLFVDRINGDFHLGDLSPAIDYCSFGASDTNKDIDYQSRGFDSNSHLNTNGPFDLGADEYYAQNFATVGGDAACDFDTTNNQTIQDAVDLGFKEIRIASNGVHDLQVTLEDVSTTIRGGFVDCSEASNNNQTLSNTLIQPTSGVNLSAIKIVANGFRHIINLERLMLTGFENSAISAIDANVEVNMKRSLLINADLPGGFSGGGIFISGGNSDFKLENTDASLNKAFNGGGIYCSGNQASITLFIGSLSRNDATQDGGGAYITSGCEYTQYSGSSSAGTTSGIEKNKADGFGGGIYASAGAKVILYGHKKCDGLGNCVGNNTQPVNVTENISDYDNSGGERGGGIYLTGSGTTVEIYAGLIQDNTSHNGAGVYVNDQAHLTVARLESDCWDDIRCNFFSRNMSSTTGGAIQSDQGVIDISSAYFEENQASSGSALYAFGSQSISSIEGSVFNHNNNQGNADDFVIRAAASSKVEIIHSTFADNFIQNSATFGIASNSELKLYSSIINDPEGDVLDTNPGTTTIDCVMAHETTSFTGTNIIQADPVFIDSANRDYHLSQSSPAIDACADNSPQFTDIDFEQFGNDNLWVTDASGIFDMGADETQTNPDIIFKNGFE